MGLMRDVLLAGSQNAWLRERAVKLPFVRRSVKRFMPGERFADALAAAAEQERRGIASIVTQLGENVTRLEEAEAVTRHYLDAYEQIAATKLDVQVSVKLTQLGLDLDKEACFANLRRLLERAAATGNFLWIDIEYSRYVDVTLELYRRARELSPRVGVCLQAYLRRTPADLETLLPLAPALRLVKGAYKEPPEVAYPDKRDVDAAFFRLAERFLGHEACRRGALLGIATHDPALVGRLQEAATRTGVPREAYEFEMLYGIKRGLQEQLVRDGGRLRVLISYGEFWFPWYMRRLAERPANVWFVARNLLG
jgi:proline dehydrogenase